MLILKSLLYNLSLVTLSLFLVIVTKKIELHFNIFQNFLSHDSIMIIGTILVLTGFIVRVYVSLIYYKNKMKVLTINSQKHLITEFPFNISRNPLYAGLIFFAFGSSLVYSSVISLVGAILFSIFLHFIIIKHEEKDLESFFGVQYLEWKNKVPRWF